MKPRDALFLSLGALSFPLGYHLACRYSGRHFLSVVSKEK